MYSLALAAGSLDCGARIERATSTDTVISCAGEKGYRGLNQKFVYDIRAKALVSHFAYQPFAMMRVLNVSGRTVFVGSDLRDCPHQPCAGEDNEERTPGEVGEEERDQQRRNAAAEMAAHKEDPLGGAPLAQWKPG